MIKKFGVLFIFLISIVVISGWLIVQGTMGSQKASLSADIGQSNGDNMVVEKGDHVSVNYWGTLDDGTQFDTSEGRGPLEFDVGAGQMIKGFDDGVVGMKVNETKSIKIVAKDAYGDADPKMVIDVSIQDLAKNNITPSVGMRLYSQGVQGVITKVTNSTATTDFNHPLAGKTLIFKIKMLEITKKK